MVYLRSRYGVRQQLRPFWTFTTEHGHARHTNRNREPIKTPYQNYTQISIYLVPSGTKLVQIQNIGTKNVTQARINTGFYLSSVFIVGI